MGQVCRPGAYITAAVAVGAIATSVAVGALIGWAAWAIERRTRCGR